MSKQIEHPPQFRVISPAKDAAQSSQQEAQQSADEQPEAVQQGQQVQAVQSENTIVEWHQLIGAARLMWSKVTEAELLASEGEEQKLTNIISARYVLSRNTANTQVKKFLTTQLIAFRFQPQS
jgi:hypothetical protein